MLWTIARYELRQLLRSRQFWFVGFVFGAFAFLLMIYAGEIAGGGNVNTNAPTNIMLFVNILTLFGMFMVASMVASTVTKDFELNVWQVVFSYPVAWRTYLLGKFLGCFIAAALCYAFVLPGLMAGVHAPWASGEVGPFVIGHYLYAYIVLAVPNLFVMSAILFALSTLTRRSLYAYAGAVFLFVLYNSASLALNNEAVEKYVFMVDLFGHSVQSLTTRYWTPYELNTQLIPLTGDLLWNRIIWLAIGGIALGWALLRFDAYPRSPKAKGAAPDAERQAPRSRLVRPVASQHSGLATTVHQLIARSKLESRAVIRSIPFLVLLILGLYNSWAATTFVDPVFGSPPLPVTRVLVDAVTGGTVLTLLIVVAYYSGELVWRERLVRLDQMVDAMPVRNWVFLLSKMFALWAVILGVLAVTGLAMILLQWSRDTPVEWSMYVKELSFTALPFVWISVLVFLCQVLSPNKYVGMLFMVIYIALLISADALFDKQNLVLFGMHPDSPISALANSNWYRVEALKYDLYWGVLALGLALLVALLWRRGTDEGLRNRFVLARRRLKPANAAMLVASLLAFLGIGRWVYVEDYIDNPVPPSEKYTEAFQLRYEEVMRPLENQPIAMIKSMRLEVDTFIGTRQILSRGEVLLENRSDTPLNEVYVGVPPESREAKLDLEGGAVAEEFPLIRHYRYDLAKPMAPGDTRVLKFDFTIDHSEFPGGTADARLETSGTALYLNFVTPSLGYTEFLALEDPDEREKHGLPRKRAHRATLEETWGRKFGALFAAGDHMHFDGVFSVDQGQTAFLSGDLVNSWDEEGRSYFHYKTSDTPIVVFMTLQQGDYQVLRDSSAGIDLAIHYQDGYHVEDFMRHFKFATNYFSENFGRYPYKEFRITQKAHGLGANSNSGHLTFGEFAGFISDLEYDVAVDWGTLVIGHEAGHNWWGIMVPSSKTEGSHTLQETLAQYAGVITLEHSYDRGHVGRFLRHALKRYHTQRNSSKIAEVPLIRSVQETDYVHYWKGAPVIYGVKELIGESAMNQALSDYFAEWAFASGEYPTTLDLMRHLRAQTPPEYQDTLTDYFERILMHDLRITEASVSPTDDGRFRVSATVHTEKLERTPDGRETPTQINEPIQIVVVDQSIEDSDRYGARLLADSRIWINQEKTVVEYVVDEEPAAIIVDPYHNYIERNFDDNVGRL